MKPSIKRLQIKAILFFLIFISFQKESNAIPPNWSVNPADYSQFQNLTVQLLLNGSPSYGSGNMIGIFVNGEVRGVANEYEFLPSYFFLNAYSNNSSDELSFKVYIAAELSLIHI